MHAEKEFWCRLFPPLLLLVKASWTLFGRSAAEILQKGVWQGRFGSN